MLTVAIYIQDTTTSQYNRVDLFDDEKISVTSSIQNINDLSKTYCDFSQTFVVPATKQNNKIFKHWYDNSNDIPFNTLVKSNAFIEIDTIPFRSGKIQLESANVVDGHPQNYSITFIGLLGNLKDSFAGLYLKDLTDTTYDLTYNGSVVLGRINTATSSNVMFPLITSARNWNYASATDPVNNINSGTYPIRYNELFPAIKLKMVLNMIENQFGLNFDGTVTEPSTFLTDSRFANTYLYLKNADVFKANFTSLIDFDSSTGTDPFTSMNFTTNTLTISNTAFGSVALLTFKISLDFTVVSIPFSVLIFKNGILFNTINRTSNSPTGLFTLFQIYTGIGNQDYDGDFTFKVQSEQQLVFSNTFIQITDAMSAINVEYQQNITQTLPNVISIKNYFPSIKIEDFFSGLLKMFNLTCYSNDGVNYTIKQLEGYYSDGSDVDITKYVIQDKKDLNRVKTYKKINFDYEKSDSIINVGFNSANNIEYGSLYYSNTPQADGEEYSIKLPFENLNFQNLQSKLQVGYCLKTDLQKYIPKPIILYDYSPTALTSLSAGIDFKFSTVLTGTGGNNTITAYKAFGQETLIGTDTYSLNFPTQQSTLTNEIVTNGLYQQYYSTYFSNIFNYKARLIKVSAILPTSILTTLKLNDNVLIRDTKYLINTFTTDLTTGEVQFELLTDQRI
jgi:hypothetical protein